MKSLIPLAAAALLVMPLAAQSDAGDARAADEADLTFAMATPTNASGTSRSTAVEETPAGATVLLPAYPGGASALAKAIALKLERPASSEGVSGRVKVRARVTETGEIADVVVVEGLSPDCDAAAIAAVRSVGAWEPARLRGTAFERSVYLGVDFE